MPPYLVAWDRAKEREKRERARERERERERETERDRERAQALPFSVVRLLRLWLVRIVSYGGNQQKPEVLRVVWRRSLAHMLPSESDSQDSVFLVQASGFRVQSSDFRVENLFVCLEPKKEKEAGKVMPQVPPVSLLGYPG